MQVLAFEAAVVEQAGDTFRFERLEMDPPGPDQVRIRIHACGICHTDMVMRDGALPIPFPVIRNASAKRLLSTIAIHD